MSKDNIKWAWRILRAKAYVIADEKQAVCTIPLKDVDSFENVITLGNQYTALATFRNRIDDVMKEHEQASKNNFNKDLNKEVKKNG